MIPMQGMGVTRERKLAIAERSLRTAHAKVRHSPEDIYWDPLVFPCGTGDAQYVGSAVETIEGIRLIKAKFPRDENHSRNFECELRPAGRGTRGAELGFPLPLRAGGLIWPS